MACIPYEGALLINSQCKKAQFWLGADLARDDLAGDDLKGMIQQGLFHHVAIPVYFCRKYRTVLIFNTFFEIPKISEFLYLSNGQKMPKSPQKILNLVSSCTFLALYLWVRNVQELTYFHFCQFLATFLKISEFLYVSQLHTEGKKHTGTH